MVVFTVDGRVTYLNPAFKETFGWALADLEGKKIPYVPKELRKETIVSTQRLFREKFIRRYETKRLTKDGRVLDVIMRGAVFSDHQGRPAGELVIIRDTTQERRLASTNETLLRISRALPEYPDLEDLLDYISGEIKRVLNVEGALVVLLDEERNELFFQGVAHEDRGIQRRAKRFRYPDNVTVGSRVIKTGEPVIVPDTAKDPNFYTGVDDQLGFHTRNMLDVPLKSSERVIGVLSAINKKEEGFDQTDVELLSMIAGTVALSIENARFAEEVKGAYREVTSLNRAKDRVINRLSHELKTPVSILSASLNILEKKMAELPERSWYPTLERARRNVQRILEIQYQVEDIMENRQYETRDFLSLLLEQCTDELESLVAEEVGEGSVVERLRKRIEGIYGSRQSEIAEVPLDRYVQERVQTLQPQFSHRRIEVITRMVQVPRVSIPEDVLRKVVDGLIRNAIENTPDGGRIEVAVHRKGLGAELVVQDYGVGITVENQKRIFEGFFSTQETIAYSSKQPFDFNAGGKGADLLRIKIFAERYDFRIHMDTTRCHFIPRDEDVCPGRISECRFCHGQEDCLASGGTAFRVFFPGRPIEGHFGPDDVSSQTVPGVKLNPRGAKEKEASTNSSQGT
jgi:PAS domain S-box-containing protein